MRAAGRTRRRRPRGPGEQSRRRRKRPEAAEAGDHRQELAYPWCSWSSSPSLTEGLVCGARVEHDVEERGDGPWRSGCRFSRSSQSHRQLAQEFVHLILGGILGRRRALVGDHHAREAEPSSISLGGVREADSRKPGDRDGGRRRGRQGIRRCRSREDSGRGRTRCRDRADRCRITAFAPPRETEGVDVTLATRRTPSASRLPLELALTRT